MPNDDGVVPQEEQIIDPGYSNDEIRGRSMKEIAMDPETPEVEEEEATPTPEPEEDEPLLEDVLKANAEETARQTAQQILEAQRAEKQAEMEAQRKAEEEAAKPKTPEDEYEMIRAQFEEQHGRNPNWKEMSVIMEERAISKFEQRMQEKEEARQAELREQTEAQERERAEIEERNRHLNAYVDEGINQLYETGKLTRIKDPNNDYDQGVVERKEFFRQWGEINRQRVAEGKPEIVDASNIYYNYYQKPTSQPAGADAPIAGNRGSAVPPSEENSYSYWDLKKPWRSIIGRK